MSASLKSLTPWCCSFGRHHRDSNCLCFSISVGVGLWCGTLKRLMPLMFHLGREHRDSAHLFSISVGVCLWFGTLKVWAGKAATARDLFSILQGAWSWLGTLKSLTRFRVA